MNTTDKIVDWLSSLPHCALFGRPLLASFHILASLMIFTAYMAIPLAIGIVLRRRRLPIYKFKLAWLFAAFIFLCGFGHLMKIASDVTGEVWWYWARAINDMATGIVSLFTAYFCFRLIPLMVEIPTVDQHELMKETVAVYRDLERWRQHGKEKV